MFIVPKPTRGKAPSGAACERNMPPRWGFWAWAVACYKHGAPDGALPCFVLGAEKLFNSMAVHPGPLPREGRGNPVGKFVAVFALSVSVAFSQETKPTTNAPARRPPSPPILSPE